MFDGFPLVCYLQLKQAVCRIVYLRQVQVKDLLSVCRCVTREMAIRQDRQYCCVSRSLRCRIVASLAPILTCCFTAKPSTSQGLDRLLTCASTYRRSNSSYTPRSRCHALNIYLILNCVSQRLFIRTIFCFSAAFGTIQLP